MNPETFGFKVPAGEQLKCEVRITMCLMCDITMWILSAWSTLMKLTENEMRLNMSLLSL